jgi:hypothetical protein
LFFRLFLGLSLVHCPLFFQTAHSTTVLSNR